MSSATATNTPDQQIEQLPERVEHLLLRHERTAAYQRPSGWSKCKTLTHERDLLEVPPRLQLAHRIDALIDRLPQGTEATTKDNRMKQIEVQIHGPRLCAGLAPKGAKPVCWPSSGAKSTTAMCKIRDAGKIKARDRIAVLGSAQLGV